MRKTAKRVGILGAGIMGSSLALNLSRIGFNVTLYDREAEPMSQASRWNEGKIHLGYLYSADPTLSTAKHIISGGIMFRPLLSSLLGEDIDVSATKDDDYFLVHKESLVSPELISKRFSEIDKLVSDHPQAAQYFHDLRHATSKKLPESYLTEFTNPDYVCCGFSVPERSVNTQWVAERLSNAIHSDDRISFRNSTRVSHARPKDMPQGEWVVGTERDGEEEHDLVINALWSNRLEIDRTAGLEPDGEWTHRYRLALFVHTSRYVSTKSMLLCLGAFGDIKNYNGRNFYASWYPSGLIQEDQELIPRDPRPILDTLKRQVFNETRAALTEILPGSSKIFDNAEEVRIEGGFVFASGKGSIANISSTLHRRDRFGVRRIGNYISVDTGKYSTAPWMAKNICDGLENL